MKEYVIPSDFYGDICNFKLLFWENLWEYL